MKHAPLRQASLILALMAAIGMAGCGGPTDKTTQTSFNSGSGNQSFKPVTHLSHRSLVSNYYSGALQVMDTSLDLLTTYTFKVGTQPTYMQMSADGILVTVNNTGSNTLSVFNTVLEAVKATVNLGGFTDSFVASVTDKFGFAAVPNLTNGSFNSPGGIVRYNPIDGSLNTPIPFPYVRYLALDTTEKHLLAFTSGSPAVTTGPQQDDLPNWVDLTTLDPVTLVPPHYPLTLTMNGSAVALSRPQAAFFSTDNTKAYVLSCGAECGGLGVPSVTEIDATSVAAPVAPATSGTATVLNQWAVKGARIGMIDTTANLLYVAGSSMTSAAIDCPFSTEISVAGCAGNLGGNTVQDGYFTIIDLSAGTVKESIQIGNGVKRWIRNVNGNFWVASLNCGVQSCVTIVNPSGTTGSASLLATPNGDASGISLSQNSNEVYTIEGGQLFIYNEQGNPVTSIYNTDIVGQGSDVLYIN